MNNRLDAAAEENLRRGIYLSQLQTIMRATHDPRLQRMHLRVLAAIMEHMNARTGMAYPGRARLAARLVLYTHGERRQCSETTVRNAIAELLRWGYIVQEQRAPDGRGRALSHYATVTPSIDALQAEIAAWCAKMRGRAQQVAPAGVPAGGDRRKATDVPVRGDPNGPGVPAGGDPSPNPGVPAGGAQELVEKKKGGKAPRDQRSETSRAPDARTAFAERNVEISESGSITIGEELRAALRNKYTDEVIDRAADRTLAAMGASWSAVRFVAQLWSKCSYAAADAAIAARRRPANSPHRGLL